MAVVVVSTHKYVEVAQCDCGAQFVMPSENLLLFHHEIQCSPPSTKVCYRLNPEILLPPLWSR